MSSMDQHIASKIIVSRSYLLLSLGVVSQCVSAFQVPRQVVWRFAPRAESEGTSPWSDLVSHSHLTYLFARLEHRIVYM